MNQDQCVTSILCYTRAKTNNVEKKSTIRFRKCVVLDAITIRNVAIV